MSPWRLRLPKRIRWKPIHTHVENHKTGHHLIDIAVSLCALIISAVSIVLAYHTGHQMERLVNANSWSALQLGSSNSGPDGPELKFRVSNAGVGPAQIHTVKFLNDGVPIAGDEADALERLLEACCADALGRAPAGEKERWVFTVPVERSFLSPREDVVALQWVRTAAAGEVWDALDRARQRGHVTMRACYCSVFNECWIAETRKFPPRSVSSCGSAAPIRGPRGRHPGTSELVLQPERRVRASVRRQPRAAALCPTARPVTDPTRGRQLCGLTTNFRYFCA